MTTLSSLPRRVHLIAGDRQRSEKPEAPARERDHLEAGAAFVRAYLMRDGSVVVEGRRGKVTLDGQLADEVRQAFRVAGIRER